MSYCYVECRRHARLDNGWFTIEICRNSMLPFNFLNAVVNSTPVQGVHSSIFSFYLRPPCYKGLVKRKFAFNLAKKWGSEFIQIHFQFSLLGCNTPQFRFEKLFKLLKNWAFNWLMHFEGDKIKSQNCEISA